MNLTGDKCLNWIRKEVFACVRVFGDILKLVMYSPGLSRLIEGEFDRG